MYVLVVAISGGDVVATSVVAKSAPSHVRRRAHVALQCGSRVCRMFELKVNVVMRECALQRLI